MSSIDADYDFNRFVPNDPWQNLAAAIVAQACRDYVKSYKIVLKEKNCPSGQLSNYHRGNLKSIEHFFHSDWYAMLTDIDPDHLIRQLRSEITERSVKR
jgi:hypothetical protein